jgi:hypothetical protein
MIPVGGYEFRAAYMDVDDFSGNPGQGRAAVSVCSPVQPDYHGLLEGRLNRSRIFFNAARTDSISPANSGYGEVKE